MKVIASLGPASMDEGVVRELALAGVSGFRINFSHGDVDFWRSLVNSVRRVENELNRPFTLITDLRGASIRLGSFPKPLLLRKGDTVKFTEGSFSEEGREVPLPVKEVLDGLEEGDVVVMDDGRVRLRVLRKCAGCVELVALSDAVIKPEKGLVVQGKDFNIPSLRSKDLQDLRFACSVGTDYVGLSYVRRARDVEVLREHMRRLGCVAGVIAKVETRSAVHHLEEIIDAADVVLVARGDLGMNFGLEVIPSLQTRIVNASLRKGKPVIIATQLLESMVENPIPTRAEVVDVFNAVREGVDALMLTGETAAGKYPVEAVKWVRKIAERAEAGWEPRMERLGGSLKRRYSKGVTELAEDLNAKLIIYSMKGNTARELSTVRPRVDVFVGVPDVKVCRALNILWGIRTFLVPAESYGEGLEKTYRKLIDEGLISLGDIAVLTYGLREEEQVIKVRKYL